MSELDDQIEGETSEEEIVDGLPVLAEFHQIEPVQAPAVSVVHAAALTAGGFLAGALAMALVKGVVARRVSELPVGREPAPRAWPVGSSRTYVVNVRLIRSSE